MLVIRTGGQVWMESLSGALLPVPPVAWIAPSARFTRFVQRGEIHALGLVLQPVCSAVLLQGDVQAWVDRLLPLDALPQPHWRAVVERLHAANTDAERLEHLFCGLRAAVDDARAQAVRQRLQCLGHAVARDPQGAASELGLGVRQLQRQCLAGFGLTPKQLQTVTRVRAALLTAVQVPHSRSVDGAGLALDHGYFDQSHLGRDMRRLVGTSLSSLRAQVLQPDCAYWPVSLGPRLA